MENYNCFTFITSHCAAWEIERRTENGLQLRKERKVNHQGFEDKVNRKDSKLSGQMETEKLMKRSVCALMGIQRKSLRSSQARSAGAFCFLISSSLRFIYFAVICSISSHYVHLLRFVIVGSLSNFSIAFRSRVIH